MDRQTSKPTASSAVDLTVDSIPRVGLEQALSGELPSHQTHCQVALIEGSGPELSRELACVLHRRLKVVGGLLFWGFGIFLVRHWFIVDLSRPLDAGLFWLHVVVTLVVGATAAALVGSGATRIARLRLAELILFAVPAAFLLLLLLVALADPVWADYQLPVGPWLLLLYTYALFIPNTWQRAVVVIGLLAAAPIVLMAGMWAFWPGVAAVARIEDFTSFVLMIVVSAAGSVVGVHTIRTLRREAFEARQLGQYRLTRRIGAGGMGEVYLAEHQMLKRPCAIKLIRHSEAVNPSVLARFQREVRSTAKLSHWNTVEIFDYGSTADGTFYYVMEYLPGMSLADLVERHGRMPAARVIHFLSQACDALREAHAAGLIHRDIKPGNLFAAERGGVYDVLKLLDFGLVKPTADEQPIHLTSEGTVAGSPLFMSPEQTTGETEPDARSDIYSLGGVGYYLLSGRPPFEGDRPMKVMIAHVRDPVVPPSQHVPDLPADLEQVILRCLAKDPLQRYQDAVSLREALEACEAAGRWSREDARRWWLDRDQNVATIISS